MNDKPKIMMHYVMPGATGGPNILFNRIVSLDLLRENFQFVSLNQTRVAGGKINFSLIFELRDLIVAEKPDIIHISGMQSSGFHCMIAAVLSGCKNRLITTHGFSGDSLEITIAKKIAFNLIIEPLTLLLATRVHCISKFALNRRIIGIFARNKASMIYNLPPLKNEIISRNNLRKNLKIEDNDMVFVVVSRIVIDKGYKILAEAIKKLRDYPDIKFIIVGDGSYENEFRKLVREEINKCNVFLLGKRSDILPILSECDAFVLPTLHENLGNVFLEASWVSLPSIGTRIGGVPEIIDDNVTGLLVPPNDSMALTNAILRLYKDKESAKMMGENAHTKLSTIFNSDSIAKQFYKLYSDIL